MMKRIASFLIVLCLLISNVTFFVSAIEITKSNADIVIKVGEKYTLEAVIKYMQEKQLPLSVIVKWETSEKSVATVSKGIVTGLKEGGVVIKASAVNNGITYQAEAKIFVESSVTGVVLSEENLELKVGQTVKLVEHVLPDDAVLKTVTWKSNDIAVVTVSNGTIKAVGEGYSDIIVTTKDGDHTAKCRVVVVSTVDGVELEEHYLNKTVGEEFVIKAKIIPDTAFLKDIKWISSDPKIVSITNGKLKALAKGEVVVTAETVDGKHTDKCTINVASSVTGVNINKDELIIVKGTKDTLSAVVIPADAVEQGVIWKSDNAKIAAVDKDGVVIGVLEGETIIRAFTKDGNIQAICFVTVVSYDIKVERIDIVESEITMNVGENKWLQYKAYPANAVIPKLKVSYTSGTSIKPIPLKIKDNLIYFEAISAGDCTILLELDGKPEIYDTCVVHIKSMVNGIQTSQDNLALFVGERVQLTGSALPDTAIIKGVVWRSSNPLVAKVNTMTGEVVGMSVGTCNIVASTIDGGIEKNCSVVVREPTEIESLRLKDENGNYIGENPQEEATPSTPVPEKEISITIDGVLLQTDQPPIQVNDRVLAPFRAIFEGLGATVDWDQDLQMATGKLGNNVIQMFINKDKAIVNGNKVNLDVPAQIIGERTMVPVRFISENLGVLVNWDEASRTVVITRR